MAFRILFADDQIPPDNISKEEFKKQFYSKYGNTTDTNAFLEQCIFIGEIVNMLHDSGYAVTSTRKYDNALKEIEKNNFDLAIVDLGWHMDSSLPEKERGGAGWKLCDKIDELDIKSGKHTPQIVFSNKFLTHPELSRQAAFKKKLPIYKVSNDFIKNSLMAIIGFVESTMLSFDNNDSKKKSDDFNHELQNIALDAFKQPIRDYRQWTIFTLIFVGISLCTLIIGIVFTLLKKFGTDVGLISGLSSVITGLISAILYKRLNSVQKLVENIRKELLTQLNQSH